MPVGIHQSLKKRSALLDGTAHVAIWNVLRIQDASRSQGNFHAADNAVIVFIAQSLGHFPPTFRRALSDPLHHFCFGHADTRI